MGAAGSVMSQVEWGERIDAIKDTTIKTEAFKLLTEELVQVITEIALCK